MLSRLPSFLRPPVLEDDEKTRIAAMLHVILLVILVLVGLFSVISLLSTAGASLLIEIVLLVAVVGLLLMLRRGLVGLCSMILSFSLWAIISVGIAMGGGLRGTGLSSYFGVTLIAGLLLGGGGALAFGGLSIAAALAMFLAEGAGLLPASPTYINSGYILGEFAVTTAGVTGLLYLSARSLSSALKRARDNESQLAERNRELLHIQTHLEQHNQHLQVTVQQYDDFMAQVGQGILSERLPLDQQVPQTGEPLLLLGQRLNETTGSLQQMTLHTQDAVGEMNASVAKILAASTQQVTNVQEQFAMIAQATSTVAQIKQTATHSAQNAQEVVGTLQETVDVSQSGRQAVHETVASMTRIKERVQSVAEGLHTLSERTQEVEQIIARVSDIAAQSNLLALNAAVEAARAGTHGRGFAVVAEEVRQMAGQSEQAAAEVQAILQNILQATQVTAAAMREGTQEVDQGVQLAQQTDTVIVQLAGAIARSAQAATQMATDSQQQGAVVETVVQAVENIQQSAAHTQNNANQIQQTAQNLSELAGKLGEMIARYRA